MYRPPQLLNSDLLNYYSVISSVGRGQQFKCGPMGKSYQVFSLYFIVTVFYCVSVAVQHEVVGSLQFHFFSIKEKPPYFNNTD